MHDMTVLFQNEYQQFPHKLVLDMRQRNCGYTDRYHGKII